MVTRGAALSRQDSSRGWPVAALLLGGWAAVVIAIQGGRLNMPHGPLLTAIVPVGICMALALARRSIPAWAWLTAGGMLVVAVAAFAGPLIAAKPALALGAPVMVLCGGLCVRYPAEAVITVVFLTAAFGSIQAFTGIRSGPLVDLALTSMFVGISWRSLKGARENRILVPAGAALLLGYVFVTAVQVLMAPSIGIGLRSFHSTAFYVLFLALVAFAGWSHETHERIARGIIVVAAVVGAYGVLRYIIGPAAAELSLALRFAPVNEFEAGNVRVFGSFLSGHELSAWCGVVIPFTAVIALRSRGRWRQLAMLASVLCAVSLFGSEVRAGFVGAIIGLLALAFHTRARSVAQPRLGTVAIAAATALVVGVAAFLVVVPNQQDARGRYVAVLTPSKDASYRARIEKWRPVVSDIERHPFGHGLGTAGGIQEHTGRLVTLGSDPIDNSYLLIAYQQGAWVAFLFMFGIMALLVGMIYRSITTPDPNRARLGIAAAGSLASLAFILFTGDYIEGFPAVIGWLIAGLGVAQFVSPAMQPAPKPGISEAAAGQPSAPSPAWGGAGARL